jgi:hypothetical protein
MEQNPNRFACPGSLAWQGTGTVNAHAGGAVC